MMASWLSCSTGIVLQRRLGRDLLLGHGIVHADGRAVERQLVAADIALLFAEDDAEPAALEARDLERDVAGRRSRYPRRSARARCARRRCRRDGAGRLEIIGGGGDLQLGDGEVAVLIVVVDVVTSLPLWPRRRRPFRR